MNPFKFDVPPPPEFVTLVDDALAMDAVKFWQALNRMCARETIAGAIRAAGAVGRPAVLTADANAFLADDNDVVAELDDKLVGVLFDRIGQDWPATKATWAANGEATQRSMLADSGPVRWRQ